MAKDENRELSMKHNQIVLTEAERGFSIFLGIKASGGVVTKDLRRAVMGLKALSQAAFDGEVLDQSDAVLAFNLANDISALASKKRNGPILAFAERVYLATPVPGAIKTLVLGLVLMFGTFAVGGMIPVMNAIANQLAAVLGTALILGAHSLICAGAIVETRAAGFIRKIIALLVMMIPAFALITVLNASLDEQRARNGITFDIRFMSLFFLQGALAFVFNSFGDAGKPQPVADDDFDPLDLMPKRSSIAGTDPNLYHDLGYHSDLSQL
ncbi:hypothetical protein D9M68_442640 [compost metagenome]